MEWQKLNGLCDEVMSLDHSGGLHAILLSDGAKTVVGRDVGRHNALDKAVGKAIKEKMDLARAALCSSGRLSLEMLLQAASAGIPVLATRKQVGSLCVAWAEKLNIAVCRTGKDPVCFSAAWRMR
jgi:FdhD protein